MSVTEVLTFGLGARYGDPETSHIAAEMAKTKAPTDRDRALRELKAAGENGLTDFELADRMDRQQTSAGKRRQELQLLGLVEYAGVHRPAPSGSPARVWRITPKGVAR